MDLNINLTDYLDGQNANTYQIVQIMKETIEELEQKEMPDIIGDYIVDYTEGDVKESKEMLYEAIEEMKNGNLLELLQEQLDNYCEFYGVCKNCGGDSFYYSSSYECDVCENCGVGVNDYE